MKKVQYSVIITFISLMAILFICSLFSKGSGFSVLENRKLSGRPAFTLKSFFTGQYEENYEKYLLDNFPYRELSLKGFQAYTGVFFLDAFKGKENILMGVDLDNLSGMLGQNKPAKDGGSSAGQKPPEPSGTSVEQWPTDNTKPAKNQSPAPEQKAGNAAPGESPKPLVEQENEKITGSLIIEGDRIMMPTSPNNHKALGSVLSRISKALPDVKVYSITGPTSAAFYGSEKYSTGAYDQNMAEKDIESTAQGVTVVKVCDMLHEHRDEDIYFRSDVHWDPLGAYYAYKAFCQSAGIAAADIDEDFTRGTYEPFLGGLYSQIYKLPQASRLKNNPEKLDYYIPRVGYRMTLFSDPVKRIGGTVDSIINTDFRSLGAYKYSCYAWGDNPLEMIESDSGKDRSLLIIKDSFGSAFVPFLVPNYSKIFILDPRGFNREGAPKFDAKTLIEEEKIDDVIILLAIYDGGRKTIQDSLTNLLLKY